MRPHPHIRKTIKWTAAALALLLTIAWIGSTRWHFGHFNSGRIIGVYDGAFISTYHVNMDAPKYDGWHIGPRDYQNPSEWWFHFQTSYARKKTIIPLWPFVLAALSITTAAWFLDASARRRALLGKCTRCRRDRASLATDEPCPACNAVPTNPAHVKALTPRLLRIFLPLAYVITGGIVMLTDNRRGGNFDIFAMAALPTALLLLVLPLPYFFGVLVLGGAQYLGIGYASTVRSAASDTRDSNVEKLSARSAKSAATPSADSPEHSAPNAAHRSGLPRATSL